MSNLSDYLGTPVSTIKKFQLYTLSGTWTYPTNIVKDGDTATIFVTGIGGGQGGHRSVSAVTTYGGNSGDTIYRCPVLISSVPGANYSVAIGAGGTKITGNSGSGAVGGATSFGILCTLNGGDSVNTRGAGGSNDELYSIDHGHSHPFAEATSGNFHHRARGGRGLIYNGTRYGTGGSGDTNSDDDSTDGLPGLLLVEWEETI